MTRISQKTQSINEKHLLNSLKELQSFVLGAAKDSLTAYATEVGIWERVLKMGREAMSIFFSSLGTGDLGDSLQTSSGQELVKFTKPSKRPYMTIFGEFTLLRTVYGEREKQKIKHIPLDARLHLPNSKFSYLLQDWDQSFAVDNSFNTTNKIVKKILGITQTVDSLERMNYKLSLDVEEFRDIKELPDADDEGEIFVISADGKGIPMRKEESELPIENHQKKGIKNNKKKMATVGTVYSIDPLVRTPEEVVKSLFTKNKSDDQKETGRPHAQNKNVYASLTYEMDGEIYNSTDVVFERLRDEEKLRNPNKSICILLMDGQESLWNKGEEYFSQNVIQVLDLLHVTPRLWQAAHLFQKEGSVEAITFIKERLLKVLQGDVLNVVKGLRKMGATKNLKGKKKESLARVCNYLVKNAGRLRYDIYLARGLPIASGVIEGACRYYVKDRMERSGMRWSIDGAQAMLDVRSIHLNGDWDKYFEFKRNREKEELYTNIEIKNELKWPLAC